MRIPLLTAFASFAFAGAAHAIFMAPLPTPVIEAPIDRALENVRNSELIDPAQRERLLGRLNLLAFARDDGNFAYIQESGDLNENGAVLCKDVQTMGRPVRGETPPPPPPDSLCARFTFELGPRDEVPAQIAPSISAAGRARLMEAERHYAASLRFDGENLRALLGHAYALDKLGFTDAARSRLRRLIELGLPKLAAPQSDWEDHAVLTEAATHLEHLAETRADRRAVARLRERLGASQPMMYVTPLVVPLRDAPFDALIDRDSDVAFDFAGTGDARAQGWLGPDAAWLVWDPKGRGDVRSGFDLFGETTWAAFFHDGFEALGSLDDNHDGEVAGEELEGVALWRDENGDGKSSPEEVRPVSEYGIAGLAARARETHIGLMQAPGGVRFEDGSTRPLYDWWPGLYRGVPVPTS